MRINILRLTFEFSYPTIYDYKQLKKFINVISRPNLKINMEDINYYNEPNPHNTYKELDILRSNVVVYNNKNKIVKELDNKIEENEKLMYKKI
jgi:hypothetical protein